MPDHTDELTAMAQEDGMYDVDETTPFRCYPDAEPEIRPRIDDDGVGYCCWDCPRGITSQNPLASITCCAVDGGVDMTEGEVCPVAARHTARELAETRRDTERLDWLDRVFGWNDLKRIMLDQHTLGIRRAIDVRMGSDD